MTDEAKKRLFFAMEVASPWHPILPKGRLLDEAHRHLTLAFLGGIPYLPLLDKLADVPKPSFKIGPAGYFDACLLLPRRHPHAVAWHVKWLGNGGSVALFQKSLSDWLLSLGIALENREWAPHVTICRMPFNAQEWEEGFVPLPLYASSLHLYESIGGLKYVPLWSHPIKPPFEELNHTADLAFRIQGEDLDHLYQNAFTALSFKAPEFIEFFRRPSAPLQNLDDLIIALNQILSEVDRTIGCPLKAVSFHGNLEQMENQILTWEMIVDV